jgi:tetratricopeptide (TPR) repeat protein
VIPAVTEVFREQRPMKITTSPVICLVLLMAGTAAWAGTAGEWTAEGDKAFKAKAYEKAVEYYSKALAANPDSGPARYNRGRSYARLKKLGPALADFDKAKNIKGVSDRAWNMLGVIYASAREFRNAIDHFKKANKIRPSATYLVNACVAAKKLGKNKEALRYCKQAVKLDPTNRRARAYLKLLKDILAASGCPPTFRQIYTLGFGLSPEQVERLLGNCPPTSSASEGAPSKAGVQWTWTSESTTTTLGFMNNRLTAKLYETGLNLADPKKTAQSKLPKRPKCSITFALYKKWKPNITQLKSIENFIFEHPPHKAEFTVDGNVTVTLGWQWDGDRSLDLKFEGGKLVSKNQTKLP